MSSSSLLQGVLRPTVEAAAAKASASNPASPTKPKSPVEQNYSDADSRRGVQVDHLAAMMGRIEIKRPKTPDQQNDSEDELIGVQTIPNTPGVLSRPSSRPGSRAASPSRLGASGRKLRGPLMLGGAVRHTDPIRAFPTEVGQKIFSQLGIHDLAKCARVCGRWKRSQTLNYVWFQHYRKDNFQDEHLPAGKWTRRESKQDWRVTYLRIQRTSDYNGPRVAADADALGSGYVTPKEMREAQWASEASAANLKPSRVEARAMYKDLGGRKFKGKNKFGSETRDRGGWGDGGD
ncbi:A Receptor for Ubiquitination Targets, partial [Rhizoctonia solani]